FAAVRTHMRDLQRRLGEHGGGVMGGRDIGNAGFSDAEFKFFVGADVEGRARRRYAELAAKRGPTTFHEVLQQFSGTGGWERERDVRDRERALAPLKRADDAVLIDTTNLDADQVVNEMKSRIAAGGNAGKGLKRN